MPFLTEPSELEGESLLNSLDTGFSGDYKPYAYTIGESQPTGGFDAGSLFRSISSGTVAGLTGFDIINNNDEIDTSWEAMAYGVGHILGLTGIIASAFLTGGGSLAGRAVLTGSTKLGLKLLGRAASQKTATAGLQRTVGNLITNAGVNLTTKRIKSVPEFLADKIFYSSEHRMRALPQFVANSIGGVAGKLGASELITKNIVQRSLHMGVLMGIASEPLNNIFDTDTYGNRAVGAGHGLVFGGMDATLTNFFSKYGLAGKALKEGAPKRSFLLGLDPGKTLANPLMAERARKSARFLSLGIFQTMYGREGGDMNEMDVYNFLLGGVFGWMGQDAIDTEAGQYLKRHNLGANPKAALKLWQDKSLKNGEFSKLQPEVQGRVDEYIHSSISKLTVEGNKIFSDAALITARAYMEVFLKEPIGNDKSKESYQNVMKEVNRLFDIGKLTPAQFDQATMKITADKNMLEESKRLGVDIEAYQKIIDSNGLELDKFINKTIEDTLQISNIKDSIIFKNQLDSSNKIIDNIIAKDTVKSAVQDGRISYSILSPLYRMSELISSVSPNKDISTVFESSLLKLSKFNKEQLDLSLKANNGEPLNGAQTITARKHAFKKFNDELMAGLQLDVDPVKLEKLKSGEMYSIIQNKFLQYINNVTNEQLYLKVSSGTSSIADRGNMASDGTYVDNQHPIYPLETKTGKKIFTLTTVEDDSTRMVMDIGVWLEKNRLDGSPTHISKFMEDADNHPREPLAFISGNKDKNQFVFQQWIAKRGNPNNLQELTDILFKLDAIYKEKKIGLEAPSMTFRKGLDSFLEGIPFLAPNDSKYSYYRDLYTDTYLNNIRLQELKNHPLSKEISEAQSITDKIYKGYKLTDAETIFKTQHMNEVNDLLAQKAEDDLLKNDIVLSEQQIQLNDLFREKFNTLVNWDKELPDNINGYVKEGRVYLNPKLSSTLTEGTLVEEYTHVLTLMMEKENPKLFENIFDEILNSKEYESQKNDAIAKVNSLYPELKGDEAEILYSRKLAEDNVIQYMLKSVYILQSPKADEIFKKGDKNNWNISKILTELKVPIEQQELIKSFNTKNKEEILTSLLANYSYTIEINSARETPSMGKVTSKEEVYSAIKAITDINDPLYDNVNEVLLNNKYPNAISFKKNQYGLELDRFIDYGIEHNQTLDQTLDDIRTNFHEADGEWFAFNREKEGESIWDVEEGSRSRKDDVYGPTGMGLIASKDHPREAEMYRSKDGWVYMEQDIVIPSIVPSMTNHAQFADKNHSIGHFRAFYNTLTKVVEVQEIQSDLLQKGREAKNLTKADYTRTDITKEEYDSIPIQADEAGMKKYGDYTYHNEPSGIYKTPQLIVKDKEGNQFLQLLNSNNNWVTFFVKSIIQDSAKKGYEKVLFPTGETASKVQGHLTLEKFKAVKQKRINKLRNFDEEALEKIYAEKLEDLEEESSKAMYWRSSDTLSQDFVRDGSVYIPGEDAFIKFNLGPNGSSFYTLIQPYGGYGDRPSGTDIIQRITKKEADNFILRGDETLKKERENSVKNSISRTDSYKLNKVKEIEKIDYSHKQEADRLEGELIKVEKEGMAALQPIAKFYEMDVTNKIDDIQGGNKNNRAKGIWSVNKITNEYGNTWNEVTIGPKDLERILFQKNEGTSETPSKASSKLAKNVTQSMKHEIIGKVIASLTEGKIHPQLKTMGAKVMEWIRDILSRLGFKKLSEIKTIKDLVDVMSNPATRVNLYRARSAIPKEMGEINTIFDQARAMQVKPGKEGSTDPRDYTSPFINSAAELNKRSPLYLSREIPFMPEGFSHIPDIKENNFNTIIINDINKNNLPRIFGTEDQFFIDSDGNKKLDARNIDGTVLVRSDVFEASKKQAGLNNNIASQKGTLNATTNEGNMIDKKADHLAGEIEDAIMFKKNIHYMRFKSAVKQTGNNQVVDMTYDPTTGDMVFYKQGTLEIVDTPIISTPITSQFHNIGTREDINSIYKGSNMPMQMTGSIRDLDIISQAMDSFFLPSIYGSNDTNVAYENIKNITQTRLPNIVDETNKILVNKELESLVSNIDINNLSAKNIIDIAYTGDQVPPLLFKKVMSEILHLKNLDDDLNISEEVGLDFKSLFEFSGPATKMIDALGLTPTTLKLSIVSPFSNAMIRRYLIKKFIRPFDPNITHGPITPYDLTSRMRAYKILGRDLEVGEILVGEELLNAKKNSRGITFNELLSMREDIQFVMNEEAITLESLNKVDASSEDGKKLRLTLDRLASSRNQVREKYKSTQSLEEILKEIDEDLVIIGMRVPSTEVPNIRSLKIVGSTGRAGSGVTLSNTDMFYMQGGDTDFDTVFLKWDMPVKIKGEYQKHAKNYNNPDNSIRKLAQLDLKPEGFDEQAYRHPLSMFNPSTLFAASQFSSSGLNMLGPILKNANRLSVLHAAPKKNGLSGFLNPHNAAKLYIDGTLLHPGTGQPLSVEHKSILMDFNSNEISASEVLEVTGIQLESIQWDRKFNPDISKFNDYVMDATTKSIDASSGDAIIDRENVIAQINDSILNKPVLSIKGPNRSSFLLKINLADPKSLYRLSKGISLYGDHAYARLAKLDEAISGIHRYRDKNGQSRSVKLDPIEMIELVKSSITFLKGEKIFEVDPLTQKMRIPDTRYQALQEMQGLEINRSTFSQAGGKFLQDFKNYFDKTMKTLHDNDSLAADFAFHTFRFIDSARIRGNKIYSDKEVGGSGLTLTDLLQNNTVSEILKYYETSEFNKGTSEFYNDNEVIPKEEIPKTPLTMAKERAQMQGQDLFDAASYFFVYESSKTALDAGISHNRLAELALLSAEFKDAISAIDNIRENTARTFTSKKDNNADILSKFETFRADLENTERDFFDSYLFSSLYPHLKRKSNGDPEIFMPSRKDILAGDIADIKKNNIAKKDGKVFWKDKDGVTKVTFNTKGIKQSISEKVQGTISKKATEQYYFRTNMNKIGLLVSNVNPKILHRFGEIFRGISNLTYREDANVEVLKSIFPPFNKDTKKTFINDAYNLTETKKIFPEIDELSKPADRIEEIAKAMLSASGNNKLIAMDIAKQKIELIKREKKNIGLKSFYSLSSLIEDMNKYNIPIPPGYDEMYNKLKQIFQDNPSLLWEYDAAFTGISSGLQDNSLNYFEGFPGIGPRVASTIEVTKFINQYETIKNASGKTRPHRWYDFFKYPQTQGEELAVVEQRKRVFTRGLVLGVNGEGYESSMIYFDSSFGHLSSLTGTLHRLMSIEVENARAALANSTLFTKLIPDEDLIFLMSVATRKHELGQGKLKPEQNETYKARFKEVEEKYETLYKNKQFKFDLITGGFSTGESIVNELINTMRLTNRVLSETYVIGSPKRESLIYDSGGNLDLAKTLDKLILDVDNGKKLNISLDELFEMIHEDNLNKITLKPDKNKPEFSLGEITDPTLRSAYKVYLQEKGISTKYEQVFFSDEQLDSYYPHNGFSKDTQKKVELEAISNSFGRQLNNALAEQERNKIKYAIEIRDSSDGGIGDHGTSVLDLGAITPKEFIRSGFNNRPSPLHGRSSGITLTRGWQEDMKAYDIYASQVIKAKYNLLSVLLGDRIVRQFAANKQMGADAPDWTKAMYTFIRGNIGLPSTFPEEFIGKGKFISKINPYWHFTEQATLKKIEKFSKVLGGAKFFKDYEGLSEKMIEPVPPQFITAKSSAYNVRTMDVISASDITISLAYNQNTPGEKLTRSFTTELNQSPQERAKIIPLQWKPQISKREVDVVALIIDSKLGKVKTKDQPRSFVLNIAGNGIANFPHNTNQGIVDYTVYEFIKNLNERLNKRYNINITKIVTGGQTGVDEAGTKAGMRVGIPTQVIAPSNWGFTNHSGRINNEEGFKKRFEKIIDETPETFRFEQMKKIEINNKINAAKLHKKLAKFTIFEGKWELLSLLAHPKYILGNAGGGAYNDFLLAGTSPRLRAHNYEWLTQNVDNKRIGADAWRDFVYQGGGIESMWSPEFEALRLKYGVRVDTAIKDMKALLMKDPRASDKSLSSIWEGLGIGGAFHGFASQWVKKSERFIREKSWLSMYLKTRDIFEANNMGLEADHPWLIEMANRGVAASQYIYNNSAKPAFMRTPIGTLFSRFQNYTYNSIGLRKRIYREAKSYGFAEGTEGMKRLQRLVVADMFAMTLATLFPMSIFTSTLPPPYDYLLNISRGIFGSDEEKKKPGYGMYSLEFPYNLAQPITPTFSRAVLPWFLMIGSGNWDHISSYYMFSMFPYGILARDAIKTIENPTMIAENLLRIPVHNLHYKLKKKGESFDMPLPELYQSYENEYNLDDSF